MNEYPPLMKAPLNQTLLLHGVFSKFFGLDKWIKIANTDIIVITPVLLLLSSPKKKKRGKLKHTHTPQHLETAATTLATWSPQVTVFRD